MVTNIRVIAPLVFVSTIAGFFIAGYLYEKIPAIASSYLKADTDRRIIATLIDLVICAVLGYYAVFNQVLGIPALVALIFFILFKDGIFPGKSPGKLFTNLMVIRLKDGKQGGMADSFIRNFIFIIPGINVGALIFELISAFRDKQGIRLGDRIAKTQVIIGKTNTESLYDLILSHHKMDEVGERNRNHWTLRYFIINHRFDKNRQIY